tara:strand:- start:332 stop:724 length:393 start_codon:yes stop_codon:yes gene_type:complete
MINFFSKYKFIFYLFNLILIFLYLYPGSFLGCHFYDNCKFDPQITPNFIISSNHLYAFLTLSVIGNLTFYRSSQFLLINTYLILLSLGLEILHIFIPARTFQFSDLFGNFIGVLVIIILFYFIKNEKFKN